MPGKKKQEAEFQYYEIPRGEYLLTMSGKSRPWGYENEYQSKKQHFHNLLEVGYCVTGDGTISFGGKKVDYGQGMITVIPQNFPHVIDSGIHMAGYWEYLFLNPDSLFQEFYPDNPLFARKMLESVNRKVQYYMAGENNRLMILVRMILEECKDKGSYSGEYIRGLLLAMLTAIVRGSQKDEDAEEYKPDAGSGQISAALEYIGKNYMENIKTETLAAACNLSETHFRRLFAQSMNMTPLEYINLVRIHQACDLMKKTRYSMDEVAARVGYPVISTFNRNFRKIIGTSPYQYKKSN